MHIPPTNDPFVCWTDNWVQTSSLNDKVGHYMGHSPTRPHIYHCIAWPGSHIGKEAIWSNHMINRTMQIKENVNACSIEWIRRILKMDMWDFFCYYLSSPTVARYLLVNPFLKDKLLPTPPFVSWLAPLDTWVGSTPTLSLLLSDDVWDGRNPRHAHTCANADWALPGMQLQLSDQLYSTVI